VALHVMAEPHARHFRARAMVPPPLPGFQGQTSKATSLVPEENNDCAFLDTTVAGVVDAGLPRSSAFATSTADRPIRLQLERAYESAFHAHDNRNS